ncbi:hypothetical protein lerEdw1_011347 [Lerista edwardsae]|nr:hypothetical protein lerEdw1_011347 [Lerista edwardsae]
MSVVLQKKTLLDWWIMAQRSHHASTFLVILLSINITGINLLKIVYPAQSFHLKQGDPLILNCTVRHQQELPQRVNVHWCKLVGKSHDCVNIDKGLEKMPLSGIPDPEGYRSFSLLLQIPQVEPSDSGNYQCKASINDPNQSAVGHYVVVNVSVMWKSQHVPVYTFFKSNLSGFVIIMVHLGCQCSKCG